jgi:hypothetical protein
MHAPRDEGLLRLFEIFNVEDAELSLFQAWNHALAEPQSSAPSAFHALRRDDDG